MNKNTANAQQFIGRVGNASTKPSARGVNLLGWGEAEVLTDEQRIECLRARWKQLDASLKAPGVTKAQKKVIGADLFEVCTALAEFKKLRPKKVDGLGDYILKVVRESVPRLEWERYVKEARKRHEAAQVADDGEAVEC